MQFIKRFLKKEEEFKDTLRSLKPDKIADSLSTGKLKRKPPKKEEKDEPSRAQEIA